MDLEDALAEFELPGGVRGGVSGGHEEADGSRVEPSGAAGSSEGGRVIEIEDDDDAPTDAAGNHIEGLDDMALALPAPKKFKFENRSEAHIQHARLHLQAKRSQQKALEQTALAQSASSALNAVCALLPGAAKLVGQPSSVALGRVRELTSGHFGLATRAIHLPATTKVNLGVSLRRLICAGADFIEARQACGVDTILMNSRAALHRAGASASRSVHLSFVHMWDEVQVRFQTRLSAKLRPSGKASNTRTMVQRGAVVTCLQDEALGTAIAFGEYWLSKPIGVPATCAPDLLPAIRKASPSQLDFEDASAMVALSKQVSTFTFHPIGDKASSNLSMMKHWGSMWENNLLEQCNGTILLWPETCFVHGHHRAKLQVRGLKSHTMRHYSIAALHRQQSVQLQIARNLETVVETMNLRRIVQPPPQDILSLRVVVDILLRPDAPYHTRAKGKVSQRVEDFQTLCNLLNSSLSEEPAHYCWDASKGGPCCRSTAEMKDKVFVALSHALYGHADAIPTESRWTHLLPNFQQTLLRKLTLNVGPHVFQNAAPNGPRSVEADCEAASEFWSLLNGVRARKTDEYLANDAQMHELCIYSIALDVCDRALLYPLLGDGMLPAEKPAKLNLLLDRTDTLVGKNTDGLLRLLQTWLVGGPTRQPWCLLDALKAPLESDQFMRWSRAQILRLNSAIFRRTELPLSCWPFKLFALTSSKFTTEEQTEVAEELLASRRSALDVYSAGIRRLFPTVSQLLSFRCTSVLSADFNAHAVSTDFVERLNAELTSRHPRRAPARHMANAGRESLLRQVAVVHRGHGGRDPLAPGSLAKANFPTEELHCSPLLPAVTMGTQSRLQDVPDRTGRGSHKGSVGASSGVASVVPVPPPQGAGAIIPAGDKFTELTVVTRENPARVVAESEAPKAATSRRGLSPFMLERNKYVQAMRTQMGRTLTPEEMKSARDAFAALWKEMGDHDVQTELYDEWRRAPRAAGAADLPTYRPIWGGGCFSTPVTKSELCEHIKSHGWPSDDRVADTDFTETTVQADNVVDFAASADFNLFGTGRQARNVEPDPARPAVEFDFIERGIHNWLCHVGAERADSGELLILVQGMPAFGGDRVCRVACFVTGTSYNPKVFDITMVEFEHATDISSPALSLPCNVRISVRPCRVSAEYQAIDSKTSAEFVRDAMQCMIAPRLYHAEYTTICPDQTLLWSQITSLNEVGLLWEPSMRKPLSFGTTSGERARRQRSQTLVFESMMSTDPLSDEAALVATSSSHRRPQGRSRPDRNLSRASANVSSAVGGGGTSTAMVVDLLGDFPSDDVGEESAGSAQPFLAVTDRGQVELDVADEDEVSELSDNELDELGATFLEQPHGDNRFIAEVVDAESVGAPMPDPQTIGSVTAGLEALVPDIGLEPSGAGSSSDVVAFGAAAPPEAAAEAAAEAPAESRPWEEVSDPSPMGYCYLGGRSVLRIQRGKPANSVTVNCYRHSGCHLLLAASRCPSDAVLKQWLFEVDQLPPGASPAERRAMAQRHMNMAKSRWSKGGTAS